MKNHIHYNQVKHGHVERASDWPYSSIHRYIADGIVDVNWGFDDAVDKNAEFGER